MGFLATLVGKRNEALKGDYASILICAKESMSGLVMLTPFLQCLRHHYPQSHIALCASSEGAQLIYPSPWVDEVIKEDLGDQKWDLAVVASPSKENLVLAKKSEARVRIGYFFQHRFRQRFQVSKALTHYRCLNLDPLGKEDHLPILKQYQSLAEILGLSNYQKFTPKITRKADSESFFEASSKAKIVFYLGRHWLSESFGEKDLEDLIQAVEELGEVVFALSERDERYFPGIKKEKIVCDLPRWVTLLSQTDLLVTCSGGLVQLADALDIAVVTAIKKEKYFLSSRVWKPTKSLFRQVLQTHPSLTKRGVFEATKDLLCQLAKTNGRSC